MSVIGSRYVFLEKEHKARIISGGFWVFLVIFCCFFFFFALLVCLPGITGRTVTVTARSLDEGTLDVSHTHTHTQDE